MLEQLVLCKVTDRGAEDKALTDQVALNAWASLPHLRELNASGNSLLTDGAFPGDVLSRLSDLRVAGTNVSTPTLLERLGETARVLDAQRCALVDANALYVWARGALVERVRLPTGNVCVFHRAVESCRFSVPTFASHTRVEKQILFNGATLFELRRGQVFFFNLGYFLCKK